MKSRLLICYAGWLLSSCATGRPVPADYKKDVLLRTNYGDMVLRLSDETPLHRDNFIKLVKRRYYKDVLFHRVIQYFMIQSGDPDSRKAPGGKPLGEGGPGYTVPAEFRAGLFHRKGALAAAREGDDVNPLKASSGSQFYIVQGKVWTNGGLDTLEVKRLNGRKIPAAYRQVYTTVGGTPHLDQNYTVFGQLIKGYEVLDQIAAVPTSKAKDRDRPIRNVRILKTKMVKR
ncbi:peptidylprolyl isomerase [Niabella sp. CC-SYL272]|uniref:peptidylprolyl isomerase n=1 Tax=Niabella agricola TaxID=2891571 RepID=UPI001F3DF49A|nr:peptidylprolyl isomerase [Niabella agricola]MCF3108535.1 peptidylprolyl isomerase [Niabella agricola]